MARGEAECAHRLPVPCGSLIGRKGRRPIPDRPGKTSLFGRFISLFATLENFGRKSLIWRSVEYVCRHSGGGFCDCVMAMEAWVGVIKHRSSRETTMVGRGASLDGRLFFSARPMVRIRFPPAASRTNFPHPACGTGDRDQVCGEGACAHPDMIPSSHCFRTSIGSIYGVLVPGPAGGELRNNRFHAVLRYILFMDDEIIEEARHRSVDCLGRFLERTARRGWPRPNTVKPLDVRLGQGTAKRLVRRHIARLIGAPPERRAFVRCQSFRYSGAGVGLW